MGIIELLAWGIGGYLALAFISFWFTWILYVVMMTLKNKYRAIIEEKFYLKYPLLVIGLIGYILDILWRILFATVFFGKLPKWRKTDSWERRLNDLTFTHLMKNFLRGTYPEITPDSKRYKVAWWICEVLLEPYDPEHCDLCKMKQLREELYNVRNS